jgi:HAD domain in Swiss Army Knife RNA repair proteins
LKKITKINKAESLSELKMRATEIEDWVLQQDYDINYVILDDDKSISKCSENIKNHWVKIDSSKGFTAQDLEKALGIIA